MTLSGVSVLVAGAGLAGLAAARDLAAMGASVVVVEARDRVGGRVLTARNGFVDGQHAEAGGDMIDEAHTEMWRLAKELGLSLTRILGGGFGAVRQDRHGRRRVVVGRALGGWERLTTSLAAEAEPYRLVERRWDSPIADALARRSVARWLDDEGADEELRTLAIALRSFFLADPDELSLLALVDQFSDSDTQGSGRMYRVRGGNDRLTQAMASLLGDRVRLNTELLAVSHRGRGVRVTVRHRRQVAQLQADYLVLGLPAPLLRRIPITPALPPQQHDAVARLKSGRATKTLVQFSRRFWRVSGRPRLFGSALPFGALWDGNEEQRGRAGILALLAGGSASDLTRDIVAKEGLNGLVRSLDWLGAGRADAIGSTQVVWENDPWARGGYAFFDPTFDPALRGWLARPFGSLFFAGEHTSVRWQGYMNGAVESGRRAAAEIAAAHDLGPT